MTNILNTKIILSIATIVTAAALIAGATFAFFSDTETSTDNTFVAGAIDLLVENTSYAFDHNIPDAIEPNGTFGLAENTTWNMNEPDSDPIGKFFDFVDLKPGDYGEDTISLTVDNNDAWVCAATDITEGADSDLAENINFAFWADDGDNVYEGTEEIFLQGPASGLTLGEGKIALADSSDSVWGTGPVPGASTVHVGKVWCYGLLTPAPIGADNTANLVPAEGATGFTCNGSAVTAGQGETLMGDIQFYAVQARNNDDFTCSEDYTPVWPQV